MPFIGMLAMRMRTSGPCAKIETMKSFGIRCPIICGMLYFVQAMRSLSLGGRFVVRMWTSHMDRSTKWAIVTLVTLVTFVLILAFYGYSSGAWDANGRS